MESAELSYRVKHPRAVFNLVLFGFWVIIWSFKVADWAGEGGMNGFFTAGAALLDLLLVISMILIVRRMTKPLTLKLEPDAIVGTDGRRYAADVLDRIIVHGSRIGCRVKGRRTIPTALYFRFLPDEEPAALRDLTDWAERNGFKLERRFFQSWY
ncbi:hypothetical protein [Gorillibacterium sp. sgz5001074]|uniref:hypothetical protein n=1 Tax=Gorillibacterium sp. sgz5001074 TaxID=3446695 RepID=UPI003F663DD7